MRITMVRKVRPDGSPCAKCAQIERRLIESGYRDRIDRIVIADESDPDSEGMRLAREHAVDNAPFFLVENEAGRTHVYTVFFRFLREVLQGSASEEEELSEILDRNPQLDFL
jgi:hypothetical protein